ncbi:MAG: hypothetical protein GX571_06805 [Lentisphaerae bacterium]|nr:hypothetical protein [Lentisphaerota bacterium]
MFLLRTGLVAVLAALPLALLLAAAETNGVERAPATTGTGTPEPAAPARDKALIVPPFSRYEIIIDRKPFGTPPPAAAAPAAVDNAAVQQAQEEQKLARQINMVAVNKTPAGKTAVGFIDKSEKPERNYYINVGETVNGFTVVEASYEDETATLRKDEVTITLKLGQGLVKGGAPAAQPAPAPAAGAAPARVPPVTAPPPRPNPPPAAAGAQRTLTSESFRERLARQRAAREAAEAARQKRAVLDAEARAEKITKDELEKATREINLNLIRQGMKPISPVTLTPEEDAEMVRLGVFESQ